MAAVWLRFRAELRRRWLAWTGLALLLGFAAGVVTAVAAGARRTESVAERFHQEFRGYDAFLSNFGDPGVAKIPPEKVEALPNVIAAAQVRLEYLGPNNDTVVLTSPDDRFGSVLQRSKVLDGRMPDPQRSGEVAIVTGSEEPLGAQVGDRVPLVDPMLLPEELRPLLRDPEVTVVGVVAVPNDVALPRGAAPSGTIIGTPALHAEITEINDALAEYAPETVYPDGVAVRLRHGDRDVPEFRAGLERLASETEDGGTVNFELATERNVNLQRSTHLQAVTLWLLAGLLALVGIASILATMRQSANVDAHDVATLATLGFSRANFVGLAILRGLFIGVVAAVIAAVVAVFLSPRVLFGVARTVEPNEGLSVDWTVLAVALAFVVLLAAGAVLIGNALAQYAARHPRRAPALRVPAATSIPAGVGVRFACGGWSLLGRGIIGPTVGIAAVAAALVFGASLANLRNDPELYGWRWQAVATNYGSLPEGSEDLGTPDGLATLRSIDGIDAAAVGADFEAHIAGKDVFVLTFDAVKGAAADVLPPIVDGRAPRKADEIALASGTMHRVGAQIGDQFDIKADNANRTRTITVVGRVVIPPVLGTVEPGEGAFMPHDGTFPALGLETPEYGASVTRVYMRLAEGADGDAAIAALNERLAGELPQLYPQPRVEPRDLVDFGRVDGFPLLLGGVLAVLAASTLVHVLMSSVRSRRRDFATLRSFGVRRIDLGGIIAVQASFLMLISVCVGVPLGIAVGRLAWARYADNSGFISVVRVPTLAVLLVVALAIIAAELCAALPARAAARTAPASLLRSE
jgi:ABC-type antimicrobial peptide transport system permease subunit